MKIRDFIKEDIDIDVCDDYDESCYVAFCGAVKLTEEGEKEFADVLDFNIRIYSDIAIIENVDNDEQVGKLAKLFGGMAGYCSVDDYDKWFGSGVSSPEVGIENVIAESESRMF